MKEILEKLKVLPTMGYVLFISAGLTLFFISAFLVVLLRTKSNSTIIMPEIVGQEYIEIHNELQRLRLKVKLDTKRIPEKNDGEILSQSIPAGKTIEAGSKLYLVVNKSIDKLQMPDLKGQSLSNAKAKLEKILAGDTFVNLEIGGITYIKAIEGQTPETVVGQIPESGKNITTKEKVFLLVVEPSFKEKSSLNTNYSGQLFPLATNSLFISKTPYEVSEIILTKSKNESGLIAEDKILEDGKHDLKVFYYQYENKINSGFEKISYKISDSKEYKLIEENLDDKKEKTIFENLKFSKDQIFNFVLYREGNIKVSLYDMNGNREKTFTFKRDL